MKYYFKSQRNVFVNAKPVLILGDGMPRAEPSGISLNEADAAVVKGMIARGDRQHDIAAWFGVNGGRIGDISTGAKFGSVKEAASDKLPPPGPYLTGRDAHAAMIALEAASETINTALQLIRERATAQRAEK